VGQGEIGREIGRGDIVERRYVPVDEQIAGDIAREQLADRLRRLALADALRSDTLASLEGAK
jgi:hypothetical protein